MHRTMPVLTAFLMAAVIVVNISVVHSAEQEVVGQYFSHIEIGDVKAKFSSSESEYTISGVYVFSNISNTGAVINRQVFDWLAVGRHNLGTKATEEKFDLFSKTGRALVASFISKMTCNRGDPWQDASAAPCQFVDTKASGTPPGAFPSDLPIAAQGIPFSSGLSKTQRAELNRQYAIFRASHQQLKPGAPPAMQRYETTAPTIVSPAPNAYMVYKKSKFVIKPGPKLNGTEILVHFTPLDTKTGQLEETFPWRMSSNILAQGADIPHAIFGTRAGPWKMRARIIAPVEGDFSREVRFQYVMQSPTLTPPSKRSVERRGVK